MGRSLSHSFTSQRDKNLPKLTKLAINNRRFDGRTPESPATLANQVSVFLPLGLSNAIISVSSLTTLLEPPTRSGCREWNWENSRKMWILIILSYGYPETKRERSTDKFRSIFRCQRALAQTTLPFPHNQRRRDTIGFKLYLV